MEKSIDNHREKKIERDNAIRKNRENKIKQLERQKVVRRCIPVIVFVAFSSGIYGYRLGRRGGYLDGVHAGYVKGGQELISSWREHSEQLRLSREQY